MDAYLRHAFSFLYLPRAKATWLFKQWALRADGLAKAVSHFLKVFKINGRGFLVLPTAQRAFASARISGIVMKVDARLGARVRKDQTLAVIRSAEFEMLQYEMIKAKKPFIEFKSYSDKEGCLCTASSKMA